MATISAVFHPAEDPPIKIAALAASTASVEQNVGNQRLLAINADQDITILFGVFGTTGTPTAANFRVPANQTVTFDSGTKSGLKVFNLSSTTAVNVYIAFLNKN